MLDCTVNLAFGGGLLWVINDENAAVPVCPDLGGQADQSVAKADIDARMSPAWGTAEKYRDTPKRRDFSPNAS